jgi:hypothetical protein
MGNGLSPACSWPSCLSSVCLLIEHPVIISLPCPFSPVYFQHSHPLCCARIQFILCYSGGFWVGSLPRGCAGLSQGYPHDVWHSPFGLLNVLEAALEPAVAASVVVAAPKFSQCNMLWGIFPWSRSSGCQMFDSGCCFISA